MVEHKKPLKILLVEDNDADIKITLRAFKAVDSQNSIFTVSNGQECLDFVRHEGSYANQEQYPRPDLILLDINMPKVNGFEVLKTLKSDERHCSIPIVVLSASRNQDDIKNSYAYGANSFIQKPVSYEEFVDVVKTLMIYWRDKNFLPNSV